MRGFVRAKVDKNQLEIVTALRKLGVSVQHLHIVGKGCPDLLLGHKGINYLIELKSDEKKSKLTDDERKWIDAWGGQVAICYNLDQIMTAIGYYE